MAKWYYKPGHPKANANGFVAEEDLGHTVEKRALDAPILSGRFYENVAATDGSDIGSRKRHREYMKRHNVTLSSDFTQQWAKQGEQRERMRAGDFDHKSRKEAIERALYQRHKP